MMQRGSWLVGLGLMWVLAGCQQPVKTPTPGRPQTVVLITIDALRRDALGVYGNTLPTSPFIDSLARKGVTFARAYSTSSVTPVSMASLFTGLYPTSHGILDCLERNGDVLEQGILSDQNVVLAEVMKAANYTTTGYSSNSHLVPELGFGQGLDAYAAPYKFGVTASASINFAVKGLLESQLSDSWRDRFRQEQHFLWVHYFEPHDPYFANTPWLKAHLPQLLSPEVLPLHGTLKDGLLTTYPRIEGQVAQNLRGLYDSSVALVDAELGKLFRDVGIPEDALVILTADHGEEFGEHGMVGHDNHLYPETLGVPLIMVWPGHLPEGKVIDTPVSLVDVLPTVADLVEVAPPPGIAGVSLMPLIEGKTTQHGPLWMEHYNYGPRHNLLDNNLLYMTVGDDNQTRQLFDLGVDPTAQHDLSSTRPDDMTRLAGEMATLRAGMPVSPPVNRADLTDKVDVETLRAMGYVQ